MRRLFAAGCATAVLVLGACSDSDEPDPTPPTIDITTTNTEDVCTGAATVQSQQMQRLSQDIAALETKGLPEEEYRQAAAETMGQALVSWSEGLREQAGKAEDLRLSEALTQLADGLVELAPQVTEETVRTGEIPGIEELQERTSAVTEICQSPAPSPAS